MCSVKNTFYNNNPGRLKYINSDIGDPYIITNIKQTHQDQRIKSDTASAQLPLGILRSHGLCLAHELTDVLCDSRTELCSSEWYYIGIQVDGTCPVDVRVTWPLKSRDTDLT
jgi:hypothetical protein